MTGAAVWRGLPRRTNPAAAAMPVALASPSALRRALSSAIPARVFSAAIAMAVSVAAIVSSVAPAAAQNADHYVLALSWSPTFSAGPNGDKEPLQCAADADRTFVVHGLWPNAPGQRLDNCRTQERGPSRQTVNAMLDIMPSRWLINHQWRKHGTCSQLSAKDYFAATRTAFQKVSVPPALATINRPINVEPAVLRAAFRRLNPELPEDGIYVRCRRDALVDVRFCLTLDLAFRSCPQVERSRCRSPILSVDPPL